MPESNANMNDMNKIKNIMKAINKGQLSEKFGNKLSVELSKTREEIEKISPKDNMKSIIKRYYDALNVVYKAENKDDLCSTIDTITSLLTEQHETAKKEWDYFFKNCYGKTASLIKNLFKAAVNTVQTTSNFDPVLKACTTLRDYINHSDAHLTKDMFETEEARAAKLKKILQEKSTEIKKMLQTYLEHKFTDMGSFKPDAKNIYGLFLPNNWTLAWLVAKVGGIKYKGATEPSKDNSQRKRQYDRSFGRGFIGLLFSKLYDMYV